MAGETGREERERQDAERAAENAKRQVRLGDAPNPAKAEEEVATEDDGTEDESKPRARSRKK